MNEFSSQAKLQSSSTERSNVPSLHPMLRKKISSDLSDLNRLQATYPWIPNSDSIRPTPANLEIKRKRLAEIEMEWLSFQDYILHSIFDQEKYYIINGSVKKYYTRASISTIEGIVKFCPNEFPYDVPGNHWILWMASTRQMDTDEEITSLIENHLKDICGGKNFDFAW